MRIAREFGDAVEQRHGAELQVCAQRRATAHFQSVAEQTEAGDVGDGMHRINRGQRVTDGIEPRRRIDQCRVVPPRRLGIETLALQRRAEHADAERLAQDRSEEHTSELQSLMRISYAVFCLKKKKTQRAKTK